MKAKSVSARRLTKSAQGVSLEFPVASVSHSFPVIAMAASVGGLKALSIILGGFAKTKTWPALTDEQTLMLYFRLGYGVDLALALSTCTTKLFPTFENRDSEMIQWAVNEAWDYPGIPHTLRSFSERRRAFGNDLMRN
jgi:hypothetical protein